jgi:hypothetical protein
MEQTLLMKGRSLMLTVLFTLSLAALIALSGAASKAEAQSSSAVPTSAAPGPDPLLDPDQFDQLTGCPWYMYEECATTSEDVSAALTAPTSASASPSASAPASASASAPVATASPSAPAATASPSAPAARDQYGPVPDTDAKTAAPAQTGKAKEGPDTGGRAPAPAETTEATGLPETNRNSSMLPLVLGSGALLVGGGLLARRLIR